MINKTCVNCKKPMNGGVYRKPNQCPHCFALQDKTRSADNKRKVSLEEALAARTASKSLKVSKNSTNISRPKAIVGEIKRKNTDQQAKPVKNRQSYSV